HLLRALFAAFRESPVPQGLANGSRRLPSRLTAELNGKRIAFNGFEESEASRVTSLFLSVGAQITAFPGEDFDLLVAASRAVERTGPPSTQPVLVVGGAPDLPCSAELMKAEAVDFVPAPWSSDELLARACRLLINRWQPDVPRIAPDTARPPS